MQRFTSFHDPVMFMLYNLMIPMCNSKCIILINRRGVTVEYIFKRWVENARDFNKVINILKSLTAANCSGTKTYH